MSQDQVDRLTERIRLLLQQELAGSVVIAPPTAPPKATPGANASHHKPSVTSLPSQPDPPPIPIDPIAVPPLPSLRGALPPARDTSTGLPVSHQRVYVVWDRNSFVSSLPPTEVALRLRCEATRHWWQHYSQHASIVRFVALGSGPLVDDAQLQECGVETMTVSGVNGKATVHFNTLNCLLMTIALSERFPAILLATRVERSKTERLIAHLATNGGAQVHLVDSFPSSPVRTPTPITGGSVGVFLDPENIQPKPAALEAMFQAIQDEFGMISYAVATYGSVAPQADRLPIYQKWNVEVRNLFHGKSNAELADEELVRSMFGFAGRCPPPSTVILVSNDTDFIRPLALLTNRGHRVVRIARVDPALSLRVFEYVSETRALGSIRTAVPKWPGGQPYLEDDDEGSVCIETPVSETSNAPPVILIRRSKVEGFVSRLVHLIKRNVEMDLNGVREIDLETLTALWISANLPYTEAILAQLLMAGCDSQILEVHKSHSQTLVRVRDELLDDPDLLRPDSPSQESFIAESDIFSLVEGAQCSPLWELDSSKVPNFPPPPPPMATAGPNTEADLFSVLDRLVGQQFAACKPKQLSFPSSLLQRSFAAEVGKKVVLGGKKHPSATVLKRLLQEGVRQKKWELDTRGYQTQVFRYGTAPRPKPSLHDRLPEKELDPTPSAGKISTQIPRKRQPGAKSPPPQHVPALGDRELLLVLEQAVHDVWLDRNEPFFLLATNIGDRFWALIKEQHLTVPRAETLLRLLRLGDPERWILEGNGKTLTMIPTFLLPDGSS